MDIVIAFVLYGLDSFNTEQLSKITEKVMEKRVSEMIIYLKSSKNKNGCV